MGDKNLRLKRCMRRLDKLVSDNKLSIAPLLVTAFRNATSNICGAYPAVSTKLYSAFMNRMHDLDDLDIAYDVYAYGVIVLWYPWCKERGMRSVPARLFVGDKAFERFSRLQYAKVDTRNDTDMAALLYDEQMVAQYYLLHDGLSWDDAVEHVVDEPYFMLYDGPSDEVLSYFNMLYSTDAPSIAALRRHVKDAW